MRLTFLLAARKIAQHHARSRVAGRLGEHFLRNGCSSLNFSNIDANIVKRTPIKERMNVELRLEFFNLPNHPRFQVGTAANTNINSANFGQVSTLGSSREIQLNGRVNFWWLAPRRRILKADAVPTLWFRDCRVCDDGECADPVQSRYPPDHGGDVLPLSRSGQKLAHGGHAAGHPRRSA
jgi:hypothetical protein